MKHKITVLLITLTFLNTLFANPLLSKRRGGKLPYYYVSVDAGYAFNIASQGATTIKKTQVPGFGTLSTDFSTAAYSLGSGIHPCVSGGIMFNNNIGLELNLSYLIGSQQTLYSDDSASVNGTATTTRKYTATALFVSPMLVLHAASGGALNFYSKFGPVIGLFPSIDIESSTLNFLPDSTGKTMPSLLLQHTTLNGGIPIGVKAIIGIDYEVKHNIFIHAEVAYTAMTYTPLVGTLTSSTTDGKDNLANLPLSYKEVNYVDSYTDNPVTPTNAPNLPATQLKVYYPLSSLTAQLGVRFNIGR